MLNVSVVNFLFVMKEEQQQQQQHSNIQHSTPVHDNKNEGKIAMRY